MEMMYSGTYNTGETIAAEATPSGRGGISVIRISGAEAVGMVAGIFDRELPEPGHHLFGKLFNSKNIKEYIDDVVVNYFRKPNSYTGEDVIEISTHGSPLIVAEVLEQLYANGARPALPGESAAMRKAGG
jgi:tRNA modification GTPase